jgi:ketosteroid isomerase-like protein
MMSEESNRKTIEDFFAAGNRNDMETVVAMIADDVVWTGVGSTRLSGTFRGKSELNERLFGPLFGSLKEGIQMALERMIAKDDYVVVQASGKAETLSGQAYNNHYCWIIRLRDGRLAEVTEYADTALINSVFG